MKKINNHDNESIELSIVIPIYNEEGNIELLHNLLNKYLINIGKKYEIILVDDGSNDTTYEKLIQQKKSNPYIKIIKLRKNFGKSIALNTAFHHVKGDIIITMDGDLQDEPMELCRFIAKIEEGFDLVSGWKYPRLDPITKTLPSKIFNKLTYILTGVTLNDFNCGYKAYKRVVTDNINLYGEMHRFIPVLAAYKGFKVTEIKIRHHPRHSGRSKYGLSRLLKGVLDLITIKYLIDYSSRPLHAFGLPGFASVCVGILIGIYLVFLKYYENIRLSERPLLMISLLFILVGFQFISIGLLGELIAHKEERNQKVEMYVERVLE